MRRTIDTAPRDGTFVILEDDVSGSFELAQWSAEARGWVRENGEPSKIAPTHWRVMPGEADPSHDTTHASRRRPASSRTRWLIAASGIALIGAVVLRDQFGFEQSQVSLPFRAGGVSLFAGNGCARDRGPGLGQGVVIGDRA